jgi:glycerol-3-phosphate dehydrogenase
MSDDEAAFAEKMLRACNDISLPFVEMDLATLARQEPLIARPPALKRAFAVEDCAVNGPELLRLNQRAAETADTPARFLTHHEVVDFKKEGDRVTAVVTKNTRTGEEAIIACGFVVNAAGIWASNVGRLADVTVEVVGDKGAMVIFEKQFTSRVLNRCRPPADGDILVATGTHSIIGTTSCRTTDFEDPQPTPEEIAILLRETACVVPSSAQAKVKRAYAGVRPLMSSPKTSGLAASEERNTSRSFQVLDHEAEGLANFISVIGGKVTIYRRMAEAAVDVLCQKQGVHRPCQTAKIVMEVTKKSSRRSSQPTALSV